MNKIILIILILFSLEINAQTDSLTFCSTIEFPSFWTIQNGYYEPTNNKPFRFNYDGLKIINDSISLLGVNVPFVGFKSENIGSFIGLGGIVKANSLGLGNIYSFGYIDLTKNKYNAISINDTSNISIKANEALELNAVHLIKMQSKRFEFILNDSTILQIDQSGINYVLNGDPTQVVIKRWTTQNRPLTPQEGTEGYNLTDHKKEYYNGSIWVQY